MHLSLGWDLFYKRESSNLIFNHCLFIRGSGPVNKGRVINFSMLSKRELGWTKFS
jgi:hypothetical protein